MKKGFKYPVGTVVYRRNTSEMLTVKELPGIGGNFSAMRYLCSDVNGEEEWIKQAELISVEEAKV